MKLKLIYRLVDICNKGIDSKHRLLQWLGDKIKYSKLCNAYFKEESKYY